MNNVIATANNLIGKLISLNRHTHRIQARMAELEAAGMTTSKPVWRDKKYLTLVAPMVDGTRARKYIGSDPARIAEALAMIDRQTEYNNLSSTLADLNSTMTYIQSNLEEHIKTAQYLNKKHETSGHPPKRS
jgi:prefoldin subunit 5